MVDGVDSMRVLLFAVIAFVVFPGLAKAQVKSTVNTIRLADGQTGEAAMISDMARLSGSWTGTGLGGASEEVWSNPTNGVMMGMYRLIKDDKPIFYESMWLAEENGTLILRLKHFHGNLIAWEEKEKTVDFRFVKKDGKRMYFSGLTFDFTNDEQLTIYLALRQKDGTVNEEVFKMKRNK
jgi:hypothetical protein